MNYLVLLLVLGGLGFAYLSWPGYRMWLAVALGLSYFIWGLLRHWQDEGLHWQIVLEYLSLSLLGIALLIFMSLRA